MGVKGWDIVLSMMGLYSYRMSLRLKLAIIVHWNSISDGSDVIGLATISVGLQRSFCLKGWRAHLALSQSFRLAVLWS